MQTSTEGQDFTTEPARQVPATLDPAAWNALFARIRKLESRIRELELRQSV